LVAPDPSSEQPPLTAVPRWRIALLSLIILSLGLALIRQIRAEVPVISHLTNLVLMASFFGLGLGCILQERRSLRWLLPGGLGLVFVFILVGRGLVVQQASPGMHPWLGSELLPGQAPRLPLLPAALAAFVSSALPFVALGQALARAMDGRPRLVAYGWGIAGSLLGTVLFALAASLRLPPWAWIAGASALAALALPRTRWERVGLLAAGLAFLVFARSPLPSQWSPYHLVQHSPTPAGLSVFVNSSFHHLAFDFTTEDEASRQARAAVLARWRKPYELFREIHGRRPESVLVLGAGTGNDVAVALGEGVSRVVAVEVDPVILEIGRELNASAPYDDARVRAVVDDTRHYLRSSRETFDLVVFGTLDSQGLPSGHGDLPLEDYAYTREALVDAGERLTGGGLLVVHHSVHRDWLYPRLYGTIRSAFGDRSRIIMESDPALLNTTLVASRDVDAVQDDPETAARLGSGRPSTDDWPYLYVEHPTVSPLYLRILGAGGVLVLGVLLLLLRIHPVTDLHTNYLFLGTGFTLMASSGVVRLALLFGSTWLVDAVVLSSVLLTVFLANALVLHRRAPSLSLTWGGLVVALAVNYALPVSSLLAVGAAGRTAGALLVGVPIFCGALCFSHLFGHEPVTGYPPPGTRTPTGARVPGQGSRPQVGSALGMSLVGAMAGGLLGYVSMATGLRTIWLLVLALYGLAWLSTRLATRAST
jgi:SAM-dependent methyltransferase